MKSRKRFAAPLIAGVLAVAALVSGCGERPAPGPGADGRLPAGVTPLRYDLALTIDPRQDRFSGQTEIGVRFDKPARSFWLHSRDITVKSVSVTAADGKTFDAQWADGGKGFAEVRLERKIPAGEAKVTLTYDAPFNTNAAGLYLSTAAGARYAITQFESIDARRAFPSFDQPGFKTPFKVTILARAGDTVISNTTEERAEPAADGLVRHTFAETKPLPTYLIAFAVGPYDVVEGPVLPPTRLRDRPIKLRGIAVKGKAEKTRFALNATPDLVRYFEDYFDTPYPYDKLDFIAVPDFAAGAMENAGAITYLENAILLDKTSPVSQQRRVIATHAHEIAHQWFGDLVTPAWWDDIWLNEAFATWMSYKASAATFPAAGFGRDTQTRAIAAMRNDSLSSARRIREPIVNEADIEDAFDAITYSKGGGVLAMAESYLGEDAFREGVRTHMKRFAHGVATSKDFFDSLGQGSQRPEIVAALASFTDRNHVPEVDARLDCPTDGSSPRVRLTQSVHQPPGPALEARKWEIPVCISGYGLTGGPTRTCVIMKEESAVASFSGACPAFVAPNADGAGYYRFTLDERGWTAVLNGFRRMSAGEQIAALDSLRASYASGKVTPALLLRGLEAGAQSTDLDVQRTTAGLIRTLESYPATPAEEEALAAWIRSAFQRRPVQLALSQRASAAERETASRVANLLALTGRDPALRARLLASARTTLAAKGEPPGSDNRALALAVGVEDGGDAFFTTLLERAKGSSDAQFRSEALLALARAPTPETRATFIDLVLSDAFNGSNMRRALLGAQDTPKTASIGLQILQTRFADVIRRMPGGLQGQDAPAFAQGLCTVEDRKALQAVFATHAKEVTGYERSLAQASEQIDRCAAERDARAKTLLAAMTPAE